MIHPKTVVKQALTSALTTLYTVPTTPTALVFEAKNIRAVNRSATDSATVWLYFVNSGGTAGNGNVFWHEVILPPGASLNDEFWEPLQAGGTIQGKATGSVTIHIAGMEVDS